MRTSQFQMTPLRTSPQRKVILGVAFPSRKAHEKQKQEFKMRKSKATRSLHSVIFVIARRLSILEADPTSNDLFIVMWRYLHVQEATILNHQIITIYLQSWREGMSSSERWD